MFVLVTTNMPKPLKTNLFVSVKITSNFKLIKNLKKILLRNFKNRLKIFRL